MELEIEERFRSLEIRVKVAEALADKALEMAARAVNSISYTPTTSTTYSKGEDSTTNPDFLDDLLEETLGASVSPFSFMGLNLKESKEEKPEKIEGDIG